MAIDSTDVTILNALRHIQESQAQLLASVETLTERVNAEESEATIAELLDCDAQFTMSTSKTAQQSSIEGSRQVALAAVSAAPAPGSRSSLASRIVLTGGSYAIYYALAVASKELNVDHRPDFTNTEPAAQIGPFPQWGDPRKIVAMDPWGHLTPWIYKDIIDQEQDGKVCLNELGELAVTKFAVEPVWYLPGVAERFGIDEGTLRRSLFEHTGGSYPELITRGDIKVFLPPIGGLTVYCFGDPEKMSDEHVRLSLRIHDECNGSDVFGSDICTCRPYLIFGIEEAVKEAQNGGSGVVIYFRKEGRALEVVYNARKRGEDRASDYFLRTENIAGVKDMRFQALMPDILHWLGIKKIDRMLRYFTAGTRLTVAELQSVQGRMWEE
ncbi:Uracil-regulated protein 1 [Claviceps purpurea]|nr:Uracil-regulated protein 1 [Claviceps purpurea]